VAILLAVTQRLTPVEAIIIAALFIMLENIIVFTIGRERITPLLENMNRKNILLRHQEVSLSDWILREEYTRVIKDFSTRISDLGAGKFTLELEDVPRLSLEVIDSLENEGFATVVVGHTDQFFDTEAGEEYLRRCYDAAKRIKGTFTRLFIARDFVDVTPRIYDIMERHVKKKINVLVATSADLIANGLDPENDFGVWDRHCLMQMRAKPGILAARLHVYVGGQEVDVAINNSLKMSQCAKTWIEFVAQFCRPPNENEWLDLLPRFQAFPPPAGPSLNDVAKLWELSRGNGGRHDNILVLGYTKAIVDYFAQQDCKRVDILDIGLFRPRTYSNKVSFFQGNWLTWIPDQVLQYDIIAGDDILNNLNVWQCHLFFRNMATLLRPSGMLVMRASGQYSRQSMGYPGFQETLNELKALVPVKEELLIAKLWPMFHSRDFYNERTRSFDLREWNKRLKQAEPSAFAKTGDMTTLRLHYPLTQTSLPLSQILKYAGTWFDLVEQAPVDKSYTDLSNGFEDFYRILCFMKK